MKKKKKKTPEQLQLTANVAKTGKSSSCQLFWAVILYSFGSPVCKTVIMNVHITRGNSVQCYVFLLFFSNSFGQQQKVIIATFSWDLFKIRKVRNSSRLTAIIETLNIC